MNCIACGGNNPHEARFCVTCGVPLGSQGDPGPAGGGSRALVPMELGDLLEKSLAIYRGNFGPFILIALVAQPLGIAASLLVDVNTEVPRLEIRALVLLLVALPCYFLANAASVVAVSQRYVEGAIDIGYCFKRAWYRGSHAKHCQYRIPFVTDRRSIPFIDTYRDPTAYLFDTHRDPTAYLLARCLVFLR